MAYSKSLSTSIRKGQIALVCQLCENEPKMKWKCLDCGLMMCQRCRDRVHPKFPSAQDHTIIAIKDISQHQADPVPKLDFTKLKCGIHNRKYCCLYCKSCDQLVCQSCVAETHNKHNFCEISDEYQNKVDKIRSEQENMNKGLQTLIISHGKLRQVKFLENKIYNKAKQEIAAHEKALVDAVKKHTNKLFSELDKNWADILKSVDEEEGKVKETENKFREQNDKVNEVLRSNDVEKMFSSSESLSQSMKICIPPINNVFDRVLKFVPCDTKDISKLYGNLEDVNLPYNTDPCVKQQYTTNMDRVYTIIACQDSSLWINDAHSRVIQKVNPVGDTLKVISHLDISVGDMLLLPSGDLLLSVPNSSSLKLVPSGSQEVKDSLYSISPLLTLGVHTTAKNKVIIGARDTGPIWTATGPRQVIVMDQTGQQEKVFQYDSHNNPLFTVPVCITSNSNNNIAVIDRASNDCRGRVVVLHLGGGVINIYTGHPIVNNDNNPFIPEVIVTTPSDNFVVSDTINHTLHILNSEGDIITYYNTREIGIELPRSLAFSSTGQLYIGCATYKKSKDTAKIFVVDNFVW